MSLRWAFDACSKWSSPTSLEWTRSMAALSDESERVRIRKFHYQSDAKSALVGRLFLEKFSREYLQNRPFQRSSRGRPEFQEVDESSRKWDFNVSHQGKYVVFAAENRSLRPPHSSADELHCISSNPASFFDYRNIMVGVDVMRTRIKDLPPHEDQDHFFHLMRRQFSDEEWASIKSPSDPLARSELFYRHWCLKESFVKALGIGLTVSLKNISFRLGSDPKNSVIDSSLFVNGQQLHNWTFQEIRLDPEHIVCVALSDSKICDSSSFNVFESIEDILPTENNIDAENESDWLHFTSVQDPIKPF